MQQESQGSEIVQVGILVKDIEETARKLEKLIGIGPFEIFEPDYRDLTVHGKPGKFKMRVGLAKAGPIQIELMQPLYGETIYDEYASRKGYGLHHLAIRADDMEQSMERMEANGFKVIQSGNRPGVKWAYLDTEEQTGIIFELIEKEQPPPPRLAPCKGKWKPGGHLSASCSASCQWDKTFSGHKISHWPKLTGIAGTRTTRNCSS